MAGKRFADVGGADILRHEGRHRYFDFGVVGQGEEPVPRIIDELAKTFLETR